MFNQKTSVARAAITAFTCMSAWGALAQVTTTTTATAGSTSSSSSPTAAQLADNYSASVGSRAAAATLIEGMRSGKDVRMADVTVSGTGKTMGYGNVNIALSLAKTDAGTTASTQGFLSSLDKVMDMRATGMGWGQVAKDLGFKLGDVVSASRTPDASAKAGHATKSAKSEKSEKSNTMADAGKAGSQGHGAAGGAAAGGNGNGNGNGNAGGNNGGGGGGGGGRK